jgi:hypothetical protein
VTKLTALVLVSVVATGCVSTLDASNSVPFEIKSPYSSETTYRNIVRALNECYPVSSTIAAQYYPEAREGEIKFSGTADSVRLDYISALVKPSESGATVLFNRHKWYQGFEEAAIPWIEGKITRCPYSATRDPRPPGSVTNQQNMPGL